MTNICLCGKPIPPNRRKHCSKECIKRFHYIKERKSKTSFFYGLLSAWFETNTGKAYFWEQLFASATDGEWQGFGKPFDVLDKGGNRIDVKSCKLYKRKMKRGKPVIGKQTGLWIFNKNKSNSADFYICIGYYSNYFPYRVFKIPKDVFGNGISISPKKSKYHKYETYF
ncbi:MAG TPA: hypothetical protein ENI23_11555 [bacterium]|nr:hypothetical protein [bacterium]